MAEVTSDTHARIAVHAGRYVIRASRGGKLFAGEVAVADDNQRLVREAELTSVSVAATTSKGESAPSRSLMIAGGLGTGVASGLGVVPGFRAELVIPAGASLAFNAGSRSSTGFRETSVAAFAGYRQRIAGGPWVARAGLEVGAGAVVQSQPRTKAYSGTLIGGGVAGTSIAFAPGLAVAVETTLPLELMKRDGKAAVVVAPAGWVGLAVQL